MEIHCETWKMQKKRKLITNIAKKNIHKKFLL